MKNWISFSAAVRLSLFLFGLIFLFHLAVLLGIAFLDYAPLDYLWGGRMQNEQELLSYELVSLLIVAVCILLVLIRAGRLGEPSLQGIAGVGMWVLFLLFLLNTVGNILAKTMLEKSFALITLLLALLCLRMALEKVEKTVS